MSQCFVIQPFDGGRFDKRYRDTIEPAIRAANLEPYRVDQDPSVSIPIEEIENGIANSVICLADITTDNPNVWFELGYAIALKKNVVMICSNERNTPYPFDIQHRSIISYNSDSTSDFAKLGNEITTKIQHFLKKESSIKALSPRSRIAPIAGLDQFEMIVITAIAENLDAPLDEVFAFPLKRDIQNAGLNNVAGIIGIKGLIDKEYVNLRSFYDPDRDENYHCYSLTDMGWNWIMENKDKFKLTNDEQQTEGSEELPF